MARAVVLHTTGDRRPVARHMECLEHSDPGIVDRSSESAGVNSNLWSGTLRTGNTCIARTREETTEQNTKPIPYIFILTTNIGEARSERVACNICGSRGGHTFYCPHQPG